jgi:ech hydrogenase subunit A
MPHLASMMLIGMAGMFLAPFGMLISKWAVLKAVVDAYPALSIFIVFGSAATLFFWVKWMGKLLEVLGTQAEEGPRLQAGQAMVLYALSAATFGTCLFFPLISSLMIEPYIEVVFHQSHFMSQGNVVIMMIMMAMILLFPLGYLVRGRKSRVVEAYLGGANVHSSMRFMGGANQVQTVTMGNYYLRNFFSEPWIFGCGVVSCAALLAIMFIVAF